jgi:guanylate kinase
MENKRVLVVSAPSGAGKSTICNFIVERFPDFSLSISHTTRKPRGNEQNGREYHFVDETTFKKMVENDEFAEHAFVYGLHYYGTSWRSVNDILNAGKNAVLDIDVQGADGIRKRFPNAELIFILPPSYEELARRLRERKTDDPKEIERRLSIAKAEIRQYAKFDYIVINDSLDKTKEIITYIIEKSERAKDFTPLNILTSLKKLLAD